MSGKDQPVARHPVQAEVLERAINNDLKAVHEVFNSLSSHEPSVRLTMEASIHDLSCEQLWQHLLCCLAVQCWEEQRACNLAVNQEASQRIDQAIAEVFSEDEYETEKAIKEAVLWKSLQDKRDDMRYASAYLLGMRGERSMIPLLEEMLDITVKIWKVRAIKALATIKDERCGLPLIHALAMDRGVLHNEARAALQAMGDLAESAWRSALTHSDKHVRWHAARELGEPKDSLSMDVLAEGLLDGNHEVRWMTADTLARIGPPAIPATLRIVSLHHLDDASRQSVSYVLNGISSRRLRERLQPLIEVLQGPYSMSQALEIARKLLAEWLEYPQPEHEDESLF